MKTHISRKLLSVSAFACLLALPAVAAAQGPQPAPAPAPAPGAGNAGCAPGSWFCGEGQAGAAAGGAGGAGAAAGAGGQLQPLPGSQPGAAPPGVVVHDAPAPPPVVVYQPAPPVVVIQGRPEAPPPYVYTPRKAPPRRREWGLNLRLEGAMIGKGAHDDAGMGGGGLGLRFKPVPYFGVEAGLDFLGGRDYNGFRRGETAFSLNGLFFVNPRSKAQLYFDLGFGWSGAHAVDDRSSVVDIEHSYSYFGGQAGVGMEFRLAKHFALNLELLGFVRGRTDDNAHHEPEFVDANTGRTSNTSGGGLLRGGMTFYF